MDALDYITDSLELADIKEDLEELHVLTHSLLTRVSNFSLAVKEQPTYGLAQTRERLGGILSCVSGSLHDLEDRLDCALLSIQGKGAFSAHLLQDKKENADSLRMLQGIAGSAMASLDWQSPSFASSGPSQAGSQTGKIVGTISDYKRDHHLDAEAFEAAFRHEYVDASLRLPQSVYVTSSGMAAFSTILNALQFSGKASGAVLVGASSYFENKGHIKKAFRGAVHTVDEFERTAILEAVDRFHPSVIFLDTLCNSETLAMPDLHHLMPELCKRAKQETYLVLDNSCLGPMYQPLADFPRLSGMVRLVVFESLNKYYQFGFDRVTGGVIVTSTLTPLSLFMYREHLGTNMPDASVLSLPQPNRALLERRMNRIERNTLSLAQALEHEIVSTKHPRLSGIVYPGLSSYQGNTWAKERAFHGGSFVFAFRPTSQKVSEYNRLLALLLSQAQKQGVDLIAGTSFGLDTTRVYLTARHAKDEAKPFLRISVGTETASELERLKEVFLKAVRKF